MEALGPRDPLDDCFSHPVEIVNVLALVVSCVPLMHGAVFTVLNDEDLVTHFKQLIYILNFFKWKLPKAIPIISPGSSKQKRTSSK